MLLPEGRPVTASTATLADLLKAYGQTFKGCILVHRAEQGPASDGFVLMDNGTVLAAAFSSQGINLYQLDALHRMMALEGIESRVVALTDEEVQAAIRDVPGSAINVAAGRPGNPEAPGKPSAPPIAREKSEYDRILPMITALPGVLASALVADGLPVFQYGAADCEHIAAATEDIVRGGSRIAGELQLGGTEQIILETPGYKVIIAPVSDMFLCVLTRRDANLGLIRLNVRNMQTTLR